MASRCFRQGKERLHALVEVVAARLAELLVTGSEGNILGPVSLEGELGAIELRGRGVSKGVPLAASSAVLLALGLEKGPVGPALVVERGFPAQTKAI